MEKPWKKTLERLSCMTSDLFEKSVQTWEMSWVPNVTHFYQSDYSHNFSSQQDFRVHPPLSATVETKWLYVPHSTEAFFHSKSAKSSDDFVENPPEKKTSSLRTSSTIHRGRWVGAWLSGRFELKIRRIRSHKLQLLPRFQKVFLAQKALSRPVFFWMNFNKHGPPQANPPPKFDLAGPSSSNLWTLEFDDSIPIAVISTSSWLVGQGHPSEKYERQLGWSATQYMGK